MIELMKQQLGKSNKFFKISYMPTLEKWNLKIIYWKDKQ
jgi:hypothetical protein